MTASDRKSARALARVAMEGAVRFASFSQLSAWDREISADVLPVWALATPERRVTKSTHDTCENQLTLAVVVKRLGGADLEDVLDDDADAVEIAVLDALASDSCEAQITNSTQRIDGSGDQRVGTAELNFTLTYWSASLT